VLGFEQSLDLPRPDVLRLVSWELIFNVSGELNSLPQNIELEIFLLVNF